MGSPRFCIGDTTFLFERWTNGNSLYAGASNAVCITPLISVRASDTNDGEYAADAMTASRAMG
jgi:hypothetical protein